MKKTTHTEPLEKEPEILPEETLTIEEEMFANSIAGGDSYKNSFLYAYPNRKHWNNNTVYKESSLLANSPRISKRIEILKSEMAKEYFLSFQAKRALIRSKIEDPSVSEKDRIKYLELDAKLAGDYAPTKVENSGAMNLNHSVDHTISEALDSLFN